MALGKLYLFFALLHVYVQSEDICEVAFPNREQAAVACYAGNFLVKMLQELNSGNNKTTTHVRVHLLPYFGGAKALKELRTDNPEDPECHVCYTDVQAAEGRLRLKDFFQSEYYLF